MVKKDDDKIQATGYLFTSPGKERIGKEKPELRATLDLIMLHMKGVEEQITILAKEGYLIEPHKTSLILALYNVGDMVSTCVEFRLTSDALKKLGCEKHG